MSELVVCTTNLSKRYRGNVLAVDEVNLRVASGECVPRTEWGRQINHYPDAAGDDYAHARSR